MSQSLARLYVHLVFSTKNREPLIQSEVRVSLHRYVAAVMRNLESPPVIVNSVEDHVHILFELSRCATVSAVVGEVKTASSRW